MRVYCCRNLVEISRQLYRIVPAVFLFFLAQPGFALTLTELLERVRNSEPSLMSAQANVRASEARERQALGALLPQLSASGTTYLNRRLYDTLDSSVATEKDEYNNHSAQLNLTQPVWRYASLMGYLQADSATRQAEFQLSGVEQELLAKLVTAWFDVMSARDDVVFMGQQLAAARKQLEIVRRGAALGYHGQPELDEALSKFEEIQASQSSAQTDFEIKLAELEQVAGPLPGFIPPVINGEPTLGELPVESLEEYLRDVEISNPNVVVAIHAYEAARVEVRKQSAGHQPTLDLVANYNLNRQEAGNFPGQNGYETRQSAVGLQLNVPIYSGGSQHAKAKEAVAMQEKARVDIEAAKRAARLLAKQTWFTWHTAASKVRAARQAVSAGDSSLRVAKTGSLSGLKTDFDTLKAEQERGAAQRELNKAIYSRMTSYIKMKASLGLVILEDVALLDNSFSEVKNEKRTDPAEDLDGLDGLDGLDEKGASDK